MKIEESQQGEVTVVAVKGGIELKRSGVLFFSTLTELLAKGGGSVLVDLSEVDEADSTGLGELVGYMQKFSKEGRRLAILNPSPKLSRLLEFTNLNKVLHLYIDREEALRALAVHDAGVVKCTTAAVP